MLLVLVLVLVLLHCCCCTPTHKVEPASGSIRNVCCDVHHHVPTRVRRMEPTNRRNLNTTAWNPQTEGITAWNLQLLLHRTSIQHQYSSVADVPAPVRALAASNIRSSRSSQSSSAHCISTVYVELIWAMCDNICGIQSQTSQSPCEIILDIQPQPGLMDSQIKCLERVRLLLARQHCACHRWSRSIRAQGN